MPFRLSALFMQLYFNVFAPVMVFNLSIPESLIYLFANKSRCKEHLFKVNQ